MMAANTTGATMTIATGAAMAIGTGTTADATTMVAAIGDAVITTVPTIGRYWVASSSVRSGTARNVIENKGRRLRSAPFWCRIQKSRARKADGKSHGRAVEAPANELVTIPAELGAVYDRAHRGRGLVASL
jgi:hypothetical protein